MGWVKFDRCLLDHWIWTSEPFSRGQAWADLIMLAGHKDESLLVKGKLIHNKRGEVHRSVLWLAERWRWSKNKVLRFLTLLENEGMIRKNGTPHGTTLTIENYSKYQDARTADETPTETAGGTPDGTPDGTQSRRYKENKEIKNNIYKGFRAPTIAELEAYISEKKLNVDAETFLDYYTANGWKVGNKTPMKDWRATVRNWHRRDGGKTVTAMAKSAKAKQEQAKREAELEAEWQKEFDGRPKASRHDIQALREKYGIGRS